FMVAGPGGAGPAGPVDRIRVSAGVRRPEAASAPGRGFNAAALRNASAPVASAMERFETEFIASLDAAESAGHPALTASHLLSGKRLRPLLHLLAQGAGRPERPPEPGAAVLIELLHIASLLHDDVVDGTDRRRGLKSLNAAEGNRFSVLSGDYLMAKTLSLALSRPDPFVLPALSRALLAMTAAELKQALSGRAADVSEAEVLEIAYGKTACLMETACELGGRLAGADESRVRALGRFGRHFGLAYQIRDDIQDVTGDANTLGKPVGQDAGGGRWTLPLVYSYGASGAADRKACLRRMERRTAADVAWIHAFILRHGGAESAERKAAEELDEALLRLSDLPESVCRSALFLLCGRPASGGVGAAFLPREQGPEPERHSERAGFGSLRSAGGDRP
ncbi:MAG: polyprenyl synthetase family protein, partial [bacterium]|nr:polyprenyl synthetase family protein [bacterium]